MESEMTDTYRFAERCVQITGIVPEVHSLCSSYASGGPADFSVGITQADIERERSLSDHPASSDRYLEILAVYRKIAEKMPGFDTVLFHGSAIAVDGQAYIFTAKSGTGKSTHARLWRELLGERAVMVNDDKPLIRIPEDGSSIVYGTPWDGKHHLSTNIGVPVKAVCILEQAAENRIREITKAEALPTLLQQVYRPADVLSMKKTLDLIERWQPGLYRLSCNMEISAAELSYNAMRGES